MNTLETIHAALTAIRDAGLVTDRERLNAAWRDLSRPSRSTHPEHAPHTIPTTAKENTR